MKLEKRLELLKEKVQDDDFLKGRGISKQVTELAVNYGMLEGVDGEYMRYQLQFYNNIGKKETSS